MNDTKEATGGRMKKFGLLLLAFIILGGVTYYAWSWNHYYRHAPERTSRDMVFMWQWKMYADGLRVAYQEDTHGGGTPEETLQLFIDALKSGDIELASKYYIPEKQAAVYGELKGVKLSGNLDFIAQQYSSTTAGKYIEEDRVFSIAITENNKLMFYVRLTKSLATNKWKISAP